MAVKLLSLTLAVVACVLEIDGKHLQLAQQHAHAKQHAHDNEESSGRKLRTIIDASVPSYTHKLRVCNALTDSSPVELLQHSSGSRHGHGSTHSTVTNLTKGGLLPYKACRDFLADLVRHDSVEFRLNSNHLASFQVSTLPERDALLLLVLHTPPGSRRPTFASHVFASNAKPQVVVLDMFAGSSKGHIAIEDSQPPADGKEKKGAKGDKVSSMQMENLAYNTVVQVNPGDYEFVLVGGSSRAKTPLVVEDGESYVAMRVGAEGKADFPEEVIAFPQSASARNCFSYAVVVAVLLQFFSGSM